MEPKSLGCSTILYWGIEEVTKSGNADQRKNGAVGKEDLLGEIRLWRSVPLEVFSIEPG